MIDYGLYRIIDPGIKPVVIHNRNKTKTWKYGYDKDYDVVIISKDGTLGEVYEINNVKIGLPKAPKKVENKDNVWEPHELPKELRIFDNFPPIIGHHLPPPNITAILLLAK